MGESIAGYMTYPSRVIDFCDCSENTYIKIKDLILQVISKQETEMVKVGGEGIGVQFDETAICNGELISNLIYNG